MKTSSEIDQSLNRTLTILISAVIHAVLMVGICCSATEQKEKPIAVATKLIEIKTTPLPPSPKPEPPKKAETPPPPKPVEPPPPPPKKETPPPPPKPVEVKPVEVKPPTPKPAVVKTDTPKPVEQPKKTLTYKEDFMERFKKAETKEMKNQPQPKPQPYTPPRPVPVTSTKTADDYKREAMARVSKTPGALPSFAGQTTAEVSETYAEQYVRPVLEMNWKPSRAGMSTRAPSSVKITFRISSEGRISNAQIAKRSNEPVMNSSVEELLNQIRSGQISFLSPQSVGISQPFLTVEIELRLKD